MEVVDLLYFCGRKEERYQMSNEKCIDSLHSFLQITTSVVTILSKASVKLAVHKK